MANSRDILLKLVRLAMGWESDYTLPEDIDWQEVLEMASEQGVEAIALDGFDVYITADHGNTPCVGDGKLMGTGVETETKSRRMLVLKDFADKQTIIERYGMIEFPKYYLSKKYDYLICPAGHSMDAKGEVVMSHGGITVDECIVPFITIKAGENNG